MDLILNELSCVNPFPDRFQARSGMTRFVNVIRISRAMGIKGALRTHASFSAMLLANDYRFDQWRNDSEVDRDLRLYFRSQTTQSPFIEEVHSLFQPSLLYDCSHAGRKADGFLAAFLLESLAVSICSESTWDNHEIEVSLEQMTEEGMLTNIETLPHASAEKHLVEHQSWITYKTRIQVNSGEQLWTERAALFPNLEFCGHTSSEIRGLLRGNPILSRVLQGLSAIQEAAFNWVSGGFVCGSIPGDVSDESCVTLSNSSLRTHREKYCEDGIQRLFSWHYKIRLNAWRIHFHFDNSHIRLIRIGYIGKHLPTVSDPT